VIRGFKFRLYPNANQERELLIMLETHRRLYNHCLEERKTAWESEKRAVTFKDQRAWWSKTWRDHAFYSRLNSHSADETIRRLDLAFQAFFRRMKAGQKPGYPRFKGRERFNGIRFGSYPNGLKLMGDRVRIQHVGAVKVKLHREIEGKVKTASLKREAGKWFVVFTADIGPCLVPASKKPEVGIDVGLSSFLSTSDGEHIENPRYLKSTLPELRRAGRALARKKRGGANRRKARKRVARVHAKVSNQRKDHHHKIAHELVNRYGFIAAERLDVAGLIEKSGGEVKNRRLTRSILDAGWAGFLGTVRYKAEGAGVAFVEVEPRGTSQGCSGCGAIVPKGLWERVHKCGECGLVLDRDVNAARNILARGRPARLEPAEGNVGQRAVRPPGRSPPSAVVQAPSKKTAKAKPEESGWLKKPV
jgi:putative transposase